jgi:hypothetical protein
VLPLDGLLAPRAIAIGWHANRRLVPGLAAMIEAAGRIDATPPRRTGTAQRLA